MDTIEPRQSYRQTREHTVSRCVLDVLAAKNISLDDVLRMSRQEFEAFDNALWKVVSDDDRTTLIRFKHDSMTEAEKNVYFEPTEEEYDEIERDPEYQPFIPAVVQPHQ